MDDPDNSIRTVIMSKSVASDYLEEVSKTATSLTIYFTTEDQYERLTDRVSHLRKGRVSHCRGFDHVTFLCEDDEVTDGLVRLAGEMGLEIDLI